MAGPASNQFLWCYEHYRAILPHFREKKEGKIAIISSVMAWSGALAAGPYTVSKHALDGASSI
jgi:NAD(P)-dependent dehydrogenase (short-subunit alcohol dehydrogenase family)